MTKDTVETHFRDNLARVNHLLGKFDELTSGPEQHAGVAEQDLLRSAVVFLHATLEDVIRSLAQWKLPNEGSKDALRDVGLPGVLKSKQFHLGHVAYHRGKTVDELLEQAVAEYLDESNFNAPGEIQLMLEKCGLDPSFIDDHKSELHPMMKRRHWIVHRMDRSYDTESGKPAARSLRKSTVSSWMQTVDEVVHELLEQIHA